MRLKSALSACLLASSSYSFAASTITATQSAIPIGLIGGALQQSINDTFNLQTGFPSHYSKNLDYVTGPIIDYSGNSVTPGYAKTSLSFDLPRGEFKLYSESLLPGQYPGVGQLVSASRIILQDSLTVHSSTATSTSPAFMTLHLEVDGDMSLLNSDHPEFGTELIVSSQLIARNETDWSVTTGSTTSTCSYGETGSCASGGAPFYSGGSFATVSSHLTDGGKNEMSLRIPLYHETSAIQLSMDISTKSRQGVADLSHTARLFIDNPSGTFTSESGILAPIPEPESYAMMLAGLGLAGFMARRVRRMV
jgi:hypothetical protein